MTATDVLPPVTPPGRAGRDLTSRISVGLALGVVVALSLFLVRWVFGVFVAAAVVLGVLELSGALARRGIVVPRALVLIGSVAIVAAATLAGPLGLVLAASLAVAAVTLATLVIPAHVPVSAAGTGVGPRTVPDARDTAAAIFTLGWVGVLGGFACLLLRPEDGSWRAFTLVLVVVCSDTGGYVAGRLAGHHPMAPRISPKKSWEGLGGSVVLAVAAAVFAAVVVLNARWWVGLVLGVAAVVAAVLGDLVESLIKRDLGVKDMSSLLPGHGGLLDRMDSMLLAAPVVWTVLAVFVAPGERERMAMTDLGGPARRDSRVTQSTDPEPLEPPEPREPVEPQEQPPAPPPGRRPPVGVAFGPPATRFTPAVHLADLDTPGRRAVVQRLGLPAFRAAQVTRHYFTGLRVDPRTWTDVPAGDREQLASALTPPLLYAVRRQTADAGTTVKTLWRLTDGALVESVLMRYPHRSTVCISSQAGCALNCPFCATGQAGLTRNLSAGEIVEQVLVAARSLTEGELPGGPTRLDNVVFMGMGEPLANYRAVVHAVRALVTPAPSGLGLSRRHVTVSTVGLVPAIDKLAAEDLGVTLALSLHAPDDTLRDELVPVNTRWKVGEALDAAHRYFEATGRRVSIEYALIRDVNDQGWRADSLAAQCNRRGRGWVHINPIPLNPTPGSRWTASDPGVQDEFVRRLAAAGLPVTIRDTRGSEIDGACGQLAAAS